MDYLSGEQEIQARKYMREAITIATQATCERSKCGCIIVNNGIVLGTGFNSPPGNLESQRRCTHDKTTYHRKVIDKSCCMHAEERAIMDALRTHPNTIFGASLYFIRLDTDNTVMKAGKPFCTLCSKLALDVGIQDFILRHEDGICSYPTDEYNILSYSYTE